MKAKTKTISFKVAENDSKFLIEAAGGQPLSEWCRETIFSQLYSQSPSPIKNWKDTPLHEFHKNSELDFIGLMRISALSKVLLDSISGAAGWDDVQRRLDQKNDPAESVDRIVHTITFSLLVCLCQTIGEDEAKSQYNLELKNIWQQAGVEQ
jgi:hypothetical protein